MKSIKYVLYLAACAILMSCNNTQEAPQAFDSPAQKEFVNLTEKYYQNRYSAGSNKLAENELCESFQVAMTQFFDTTAVINWSLYLQELSTTDIVESGVKYKKISFELVNRKEVDRKASGPGVRFNAIYLVQADSLATDKTYNALKTVRNLELVDFSGVVLKSKNGFVVSCYSTFNIAYPRFDILILDVSKREKYEYLIKKK